MASERFDPWNWFQHEEGAALPRYQSTKSNDVGGSELRRTAGQSAPVTRLHDEIDRLFNNAFHGFGPLTPRMGRSLFDRDSDMSVFQPSIDISSDDNNYEVTVEAPGLKKSEINVQVQHDTLIIKGKKQRQKESKDKQFYRMERSYGSFCRTLALPDDADAEKIDARMKDGVLTLTIPRNESAQGNVRKIEIQS